MSEDTNLFNEQVTEIGNKDSHLAIVNRSPLSLVFNEDCVAGMKRFSDGHFDLAIVDPPYGIDITKQGLGEGGGLYRAPKTYKRGEWDNQAPDQEYFKELFRISKNQIIWGANHFIHKIPYNSSCWIIWDKNNGGSDFADAELAWTSFGSPVRIFKYTWSGFIQGNMKDKEAKIHPTQKPVALYEYLLANYTKDSQRIIDTHLGSGSSRIACEKAGLDFVGFELDTDYFLAQEKRFKDHLVQGRLFGADFC